MPIDLRSDTTTRPSIEMRRIMASAEVGDASYGEDPSTNALEQYCADLFHKEAALFTSSGTMSNQLALRSLTTAGDEVILDARHHIYYFESAQSADLARVTMNPYVTADGILTATQLAESLAQKPRGTAYSPPKLVCIENSVSYFGGGVFPAGTLRELFDAAEAEGLSLYMDGARLMNSCVASGVHPSVYASSVTALSACFSKGLGAPFGSVLAGPAWMIEKAKKYRKWYGGAMHQSGVMAAAALHAIKHHYDRLAEDHANAKLLAALIRDIPDISLSYPEPETNIVMFTIQELEVPAQEFVEAAKKEGLLLLAWDSFTIRAVTHLDVSRDDIIRAVDVVRRVARTTSRSRSSISHHLWA